MSVKCIIWQNGRHRNPEAFAVQTKEQLNMVVMLVREVVADFFDKEDVEKFDEVANQPNFTAEKLWGYIIDSYYSDIDSFKVFYLTELVGVIPEIKENKELKEKIARLEENQANTQQAATNLAKQLFAVEAKYDEAMQALLNNARRGTFS